MNNFIVDLHCHPAMKPYGQSFKNPSGTGANSPDSSDTTSIWHYDQPSLKDKLLNYVTGLTKFRQADFSSSHYGSVKVVTASLYPLEKGFVKNRLGSGQVSDAILNIATGLGDERIDFLQKMPDYFTDLQNEYKFYRQLHDTTVMIDGKKVRYKLVRNYVQLEEVLQTADAAIPTIAVIMSIEGAHVFNCGLTPEQKPADKNEVLKNVNFMKSNWEFPPFFITFAHHFYNELCGHARSLTGIMARVLDQGYKLDTGFTPLGFDIAKALLSKTNGARILLDVKHMSPVSRRQYYDWIEKEFPNDSIPIVVSHGAANGLKSYDNNFIAVRPTGACMNPGSINFFDDELIRIARSGGILGLQMDERRVGNKEALAQAKGHTDRRKILFHRSKLVWNQLEHIAQVLSGAGIFPWGLAAIGSDYDGIIDPLNGYWTHEDLQFMDDYLLKHAYNFMQGNGKNLRVGNTTDPEEIVSRVMNINAMEFLKRNF
ncbi:hypothetical protein [Ohtaekwangia koreensis]|uniref:Zn-dependent dipeptidase, dipeptidase homolog n=1 Tax=Ohtaekwangia koreensis TaxID=688867 RepID=A0A1T5L793_9BACT|nr:hypothetical protein [Ohtaekwangia koreensis]SKC71800.1 hypothetical protein SAMN05660236_2668 [Ohtaekwangia koreensis]